MSQLCRFAETRDEFHVLGRTSVTSSVHAFPPEYHFGHPFPERSMICGPMPTSADEAPRSDRRTVGIAVAAAACLAIFSATPAAAQMMPGGAAQRPEVGVVVIHPRSVAITAELPGRTTASLTAEVRPQVGGIIRERLFDEGGEVTAGTALYQIDQASFRAAFESAQAMLQKAQAAVPSAETKVERYQALIKQNAVAKQDLDDAVATLAQVRAAVAVAEADLETARINLDYTTIRAPISGRIDKSSLTPGALVTAGQATALTTIRTIDPINVDITQSSRRLLDLRSSIAAGRVKIAGNNVRVRLKMENGAIYAQSGAFAFAEANVSQTTGTYTFRASFPNPDRLLLPGMYVRAIVEEGIAENSFVVPQRAVGRNQRGEATALVVDADDRVQAKLVTLGGAVGNSWRIESGVADGDRIIVEGSQRARPGSQVRPVEVVIDDATGEVVRRQEGSAPSGAAANVAAGKAPAAAGGTN
jgi:membrane fusion protein (multidrug efflux system)